MNQQIAATERTLIEKISIDDAAFIMQLVCSPGWVKYIGEREMSSLEQAQQYLENGFLKVYQEHGFGYYVIRSVDRQPMGVAGFLKKPYLDNVDLGFAFLPEYHGQGYALESCRAILEYAAGQFSFTVLDAATLPINQASIGLLEKLGFRYHSELVEPDSGDILSLYQLAVS